MFSKIGKLALLSTALVSVSAVAHAQETVVWWDFLAGGDGVRMGALIDRFNEEHAGEIAIENTTFEWGVPFYTRAQTSSAIGEGPDVMTYHLSRVPLGVESGVLAPIALDDLEAVGLGPDTFPESSWGAAQIDGAIYAVPFDVHAVVLYYNKDVLGELGLLDDAGLPTGLDGAEAFTEAVRQAASADGAQYGLSFQSAGGSTLWRIFYSLFGQQGGQFLDDSGEFLVGDNLDKAVAATEVMSQWVEEGLAPFQTEYEASIALFTSGAAPFHINGVWEVPTFTDLHAEGDLFEWGAIELPVLFDQPATWADSHGFAIPQNAGREMTPEKKAAVMQVIAWMNENSLSWADAGHIPAYSPVRESDDFITMEPNATYSILADSAIFDPSSVLAGVASPVYDAAGNYLNPAVNGEMDAAEAIEEMKWDLDDQAMYQ